jgi:nucleoside-diphosphate-sugar epimerase
MSPEQVSNDPGRTTRPKAFLTGSTGFIGSHLLSHLSKAGWSVDVMARSNLESVRKHPAIDTAYAYTGATDEVTHAISASKPDVVFHLASNFLASHDASQVRSLVESNILLGAQLLEAMRLAHVANLVNTGTAWQNFHSEEYAPVNLYAATKQAFEDIAAYYHHASGLKIVTLRLFDSYGPGDTRRKLIKILLDLARSGQSLEMSPGDQIIDLVHVDDLCSAFLTAAISLMNAPSATSAVYALSGGHRVTVRGLIEIFEQILGRKLPVVFGARPHRDREVMVPWVGLELPGWTPRISLVDGIGQLVEHEGIK